MIIYFIYFLHDVKYKIFINKIIGIFLKNYKIYATKHNFNTFVQPLNIQQIKNGMH